MGEGLIRLFKNKLKQEHKIAFAATFFTALLIHFYKFANTLPNHDSLYNFYSDQNVLGSGRWALSAACGISSFYDLPWVIGILSCFFIALTTVVITMLFKLENPVLIWLSGALLAAAPATTETLFFEFTADGYMIAMLLSALGVYLSRIEEKRVSRQLIAGVCICVSCGIYQAYVSFALILAVCYFMDALFRDLYDRNTFLKWILRQAVIYIFSLAAYYVIWKLLLKLTGTPANDYQGISEVGKISVGLFVNGIKSSIKSVLLYFLQWNVLENGFSIYSILNIIFLVTSAVGIVIAFVKSGIYKKKWSVLLIIICIVSIIPFAGMWHFASDGCSYRPMMLQSLTLLFIFTAVLFERWAKKLIKESVCVLLILICANNALIANISYFYLNLSYEQSYAEAIEMMIRIRNFEDSFTKIAVLGSKHGDVFSDNIVPESARKLFTDDIHMLKSGIENSLLYDHEHVTRFLNGIFGSKFESVSYTERTALFESSAVSKMGCFPAENSMAIIGDTLVIKLSDEVEN